MRAYAISVLVSGLMVLCSSAVFGQISASANSIGPLGGIKGAPYCGVEETEEPQTLADGNHIKQKALATYPLACGQTWILHNRQS
jgi:hypothetical protein